MEEARLLLRILIESDYIPTRITKSGCNLRGIRPNRLHDLASFSHDLIDSRGHAVDHHIYQEPRLRGRWSSDHKRAAHLADTIVEGRRTIPALPNLPSKDAGIKSAERATSIAGISI
jgi:hypothetical protein